MRKKFVFAISLVMATALGVWAQQPVSVTTAYGQFTFDATVSSERYLGQKLKGAIVNNTTKDWMDLEFAVIYYDSYGNKVDTLIGDTIRVAELKKGASYALGHGSGEPIFIRGAGNRETPIVRYEVSLKEGTIQAKYSFALLKKTLARTGKPSIVESSDLDFSDDLTGFVFSISKRQFGFVLQNKTDEPIEIDWNKVAFVDVIGESHKVMHSGVKYIGRNEPLAPTTIPPSAKLEDIVSPSDYVYYSEGKYGGWRELPLFPDGDKALAFKGQTFTVFMPVRVNGTVKNYSFKFKITDVAL
jgi:hypothetical protein